jgi:putative transposase
MKNEELKNATKQETQKVQRTGKAEDFRRRQTKRSITNPSMPEIQDEFVPVLPVGEESKRSNAGGTQRREARQKAQRQAASYRRRVTTVKRCNSRNILVKYRVKKNALNLAKHKRLTRVQKQHIIDFVNWIKDRSELRLEEILLFMELDRNKYNYILKGLSKPIKQAKRKQSIRLQKATPEEEEKVKDYVKDNPGHGYKKYTYKMLDNGIAALKEHQVYEILKGSGLLLFGKRTSGIYKKPPKPTKPDEVWHIDIMYLWIYNRWYYLVDIVDGYSRFLVHWRLCSTMHANTVVETMQEAIDMKKTDCIKPHIVHDNGKQFLSSLWTDMIEYNQVTDIKIRIHHPESNGKVERLHRTHREECFNKDIESYAKAVEMMELWAVEYNYERPHSALSYLTPADYYSGNPVKKLEERKLKIEAASILRKEYWLNLNVNFKLAV